MSEKRYYWLKLQKDFFKRHDIKYIETLPNGREIAFFYLKIMVESVDHDGELRFSPEIPYSEAMLASVTDTPVEIVEAGMSTLKDLGLVKVDEDGTISIPKVIKMIDSASDTDGARRVRRYREKQQSLQNVTESLQNVTHTVTNDNESKSKSKS
ncbi:MAG: phage replisome organizer N-terminal domain-containing protein, partial [Lachnospiraceae bacterium]|nr:phage replisome organizer N-terminal domain-containing protein [Lachnospiraceae bacterium]